MFLAKPDWVLQSVLELTVDMLKEADIQGVMFDLDNTLMAPKAGVMSRDIIAYLNSLLANDIRYIIVSNNKRRDYLDVVQPQFASPVLGPAKKPQRAVLQQGLEWLQLPAHQVAMVGDRPLTDIWGGQRIGCKTVLVDPLRKAQEHGGIKLLRALERCACRGV